MPRADVDPTQLRRFAKELDRFNDELQALMSRQHALLVELGRTWRDQENRKFTEQFDHTMGMLKRFLPASKEHVAFLMKKAHHIDDYLQQR